MRNTIQVILLLFVAHLAVACSGGLNDSQIDAVADQADTIAEPETLTEDTPTVNNPTEDTNGELPLAMRHATATTNQPMKMKTAMEAAPMKTKTAVQAAPMERYSERARVEVEAADPAYQKYFGGFQKLDDDPSPTDDD